MLAVVYPMTFWSTSEGSLSKLKGLTKGLESVVSAQEGGGGGYSGFQVAGMIEWEQKSRPKDLPPPPPPARQRRGVNQKQKTKKHD